MEWYCSGKLLVLGHQYSNTGRIQSMGLEGNLVVNYNHWGGFFNFATSKPGRPSSGDYLIAEQKQVFGLPPLKMNLGFITDIKICR